MNPHTDLALQRKYRAETWKAWAECYANIVLAILYLSVIGAIYHLVQKLTEL